MQFLLEYNLVSNWQHSSMKRCIRYLNCISPKEIYVEVNIKTLYISVTYVWCHSNVTPCYSMPLTFYFSQISVSLPDITHIPLPALFTVRLRQTLQAWPWPFITQSLLEYSRSVVWTCFKLCQAELILWNVQISKFVKTTNAFADSNNEKRRLIACQ